MPVRIKENINMSLSESTREVLRERCGHDVQVIDRNSSFKYNCSCCGDCCRNREGSNAILLSTQDIFYLAKGLNMKIKDFIQKHTEYSVGGSSGLTVVYLKNEATYTPLPFAKMIPTGSKCTFLEYKEGKYVCSVQDFKPSVCRIFPLGRISSSEKKTDLTYFLQTVGCQKNKKESEAKTYSLEEWIPNLERNEREFKKHSEFLQECFGIIDFRAVYDSKKISEVYKNFLFISMLEFWYGAFDTSIGYLEQFDSVKEKFFEIIKNLVSILQEKDSTVKGKEFNDFINIEDATIYIATLLMQK